jgi:hypothetical protein
MTNEELKKFYSTFNSLDLTNLDSFKDFSETMLQLGLSIPEEEMQDFIQVC